MWIVKLFALLIVILLVSETDAASVSNSKNCRGCHKKLVSQKNVHAAVGLGCSSCHSAIASSKVPHAKTTTNSFGLSTDQPDLCYGCHDKAAFAGETVHPALGLGCTKCHNPHSSQYRKLLVKQVPVLCFTCHSKTDFKKKHIHPPVVKGKCLTCHAPHATNNMALLVKSPVDLCLQCHPSVAQRPHVLAAAGSAGHPTGLGNKDGIEEGFKDPARPRMSFYCGSCHNPHSSDNPSLYRFKAKAAYDLCVYCHKM
jgi:predicted CXXCH cytochrome family protein